MLTNPPVPSELKAIGLSACAIASKDEPIPPLVAKDVPDPSPLIT